MIRQNKVLRNILCLLLIFGIIGETVIFLVLRPVIYLSVGFLTGIAAGMFYMYFLADSLDIALDMNSKGARVKMQVTAMIRNIVLLALAAVLYYTGWGDVLAYVVGMLMMKVATYLQPITDKMLQKFKRKGR